MSTYPPDVVASYRAQGLWGANPIGDELRAIARRHPHREAVVTTERRLNYAHLDWRSDLMAQRMRGAGLRRGDRVVLQVGNTAETIEAFYALLKLGALPVCTLVQHGHHEIDTVATLVGARAHLVQADHPGRDLVAFAREVSGVVDSMELLLTIRGAAADAVALDPPADDADDLDAEADGEIQPDDVAVLQLSGGTTGTPKVIPRLHAEYWYNGRATAQRWQLDADDRVGHFLPVVHNAGIHGALFAAHAVGATLVLGAGWSPAEVLRTIADEHVTTTMLITGLVTSLLDRPGFREATASLRRLSLAGAPVAPALFDRLADAGVPVFQNFGMSEGFCTAMPPDAPPAMRRDSVGYALSRADELRLLEPGTNDAVPEGRPGELCVRGPYTIRGYAHADAHNRAAFTPDGFYRTGDLARVVRIDGHDCLRIEGRIKDLINRGGEKINAEEIETLLVAHPAIAEAALVAMPDERLGERACAFVVPSGEAAPTLATVSAFLAELGVARYKWPERLETVAALPRTAVGKVAKRELQAAVERQHPQPTRSR